MTILKAFLYTLLLIAIEAILSLGILRLKEVLNLSPEYLLHYGRATRIVTVLLVYFIMLFLIFKLRISAQACLSSIKNSYAKTWLWVLVIVIGYKLLQKPLIDIPLIIDSIKNNAPDPIQHLPDKYNFLLVYKFFSAVILAPVLEELFFRKILFKGLLQKYSFALAAIVSSLCFAFIDWTPDMLRIMPTFIFGIICCLIYVKTRNIIYPIFFHFVGNLLSVSISFYAQELLALQHKLNYNWVYWMVFVMGIVLTILGLRMVNKAKSV